LDAERLPEPHPPGEREEGMVGRHGLAPRVRLDAERAEVLAAEAADVLELGFEVSAEGEIDHGSAVIGRPWPRNPARARGRAPPPRAPPRPVHPPSARASGCRASTSPPGGPSRSRGRPGSAPRSGPRRAPAPPPRRARLPPPTLRSR